MTPAGTPQPFGPYLLHARLAAGGMAEVFLATEAATPTGRWLAIKRIRPHLAGDSGFVRMFLQEARLAARLVHPAIAPVIDVGRVDDAYFMAMAYVHGEDLRRVMQRCRQLDRPLPVTAALQLVRAACDGLGFAHDARDDAGQPLALVHRDVSPHNLVATFDGGVQVIDFGVAKAVDNWHRTHAGTLKGKYGYMSPEQAAGTPLDRRNDIFSLGVVLYELLTGARLFRRESDAATLEAVLRCEVEPPSTRQPTLDPAVDAVVMAALARDREQRTPSMQALAAELDQLLSRRREQSSLKQLMRELFADRLAEEKRTGRPIGEPIAVVAAPSANELPPTPALPRGGVAVREASEVPPRRRKVIVGAVVLGALIVAVIAFGLLR